jgi:hypothetical protein
MATIDFVKIGRDAASSKKTEQAAVSAAKLAKGGGDLTDSELASLTQGYTSSTPNYNPSAAASTMGRNAATGFGGLATIKGTTFGGSEAIGIPETISSVQDILTASATGWKGVITAGVGMVANQVTEVYRQETVLRNEINKGMGVTGMLGDDIRDSIITSAAYGQRFAFSIADSVSAFIGLNQETGRFATFSDKILQKGFATAGAFLPTLGELGQTFAQFEKIGVGFSDTLTQLNDIAKQSMVIGLNGKQTIKDVRENIDSINRYNFKNGTQGLAEMSRVAKIFRTDMRDAFSVAEKVMDPEGAIEMSARLQALGGSIGEFNDVYKLMYDSVNDPGAIQKALIGMSSGLASYNEEAGKFELTGYGIRMLSEQAKITGVDYKNLASGAIAAQEKMRGLQQLASNGLNIEPNEKDFLLNLAHMEHGEMKITIPPDLQDKFKKLGGSIESELKDTGMISFRNMNQEAFARFEAYQDQFENAFPEDIARGQYTLIQNISNDVSALASIGRATAVKSAGGVLRGMGLEGGIQYAANLLDQNISNLTRAAGSKDGLSNDVKAKTEEAFNFLSFGLTNRAKDAFIKIENQLAAEHRAKLKEQNGKTGQIKTTSLIEETVGGRATSAVNSSNTQISVKHEFAWQPNNMVNELQKQATKNNNIMSDLMGDQNPNSYLNPAGIMTAMLV